MVTRKQTPAPTLAKLDDPRDDDPESQTDVEQTAPGTSHLPELSSGDHSDDVIHIALSPLDFSQSTTDVNNGALPMRGPFLR